MESCLSRQHGGTIISSDQNPLNVVEKKKPKKRSGAQGRRLQQERRRELIASYSKTDLAVVELRWKHGWQRFFAGQADKTMKLCGKGWNTIHTYTFKRPAEPDTDADVYCGPCSMSWRQFNCKGGVAIPIITQNRADDFYKTRKSLLSTESDDDDEPKLKERVARESAIDATDEMLSVSSSADEESDDSGEEQVVEARSGGGYADLSKEVGPDPHKKKFFAQGLVAYNMENTEFMEDISFLKKDAAFNFRDLKIASFQNNTDYEDYSKGIQKSADSEVRKKEVTDYCLRRSRKRSESGPLRQRQSGLRTTLHTNPAIKIDYHSTHPHQYQVPLAF
jgi:hypothetical protein